MKTLAIIAKSENPEVTQYIDRVMKWAKEKSVDFFLSKELIPLVGYKDKSVDRDQLWKYGEVLVSLGGDGTMLAAARAIGPNGIPILGVNLGSLGFLTEVRLEELEKSLDKVKKGEFFIEKRMVLEAKVEGKESVNLWGLNDIVIDKGNFARVIEMDLHAQEEFVCSYSADGLIISTPTGSTAYSMAAGGPIINPKNNAIIATPICPHSLALRPMIFSENETLRIKVESFHREFMVTADGQVALCLPSGSSLIIHKANHTANLIRLGGRSFYNILRTKLHWGVKPKIGE
jgi:NAD+ kinase